MTQVQEDNSNWYWFVYNAFYSYFPKSKSIIIVRNVVLIYFVDSPLSSVLRIDLFMPILSVQGSFYLKSISLLML